MDSRSDQYDTLASNSARPDDPLPAWGVPGQAPGGGQPAPHAVSLAGLCVAAALFNVFAIPFARGLGDDFPWIVLWGGLIFGILPGEMGALTLWFVFGEGPFLRRLVTHWAVGTALLMCFVIGLLAATFDINTPRDLWRDIGGMLCLMPLASLAAQAPLWPWRTHLGWRLERCPGHARTLPAKALSISDILLGTAVTAVTLTLVRLSPDSSPALWARAAIMAGAIFVASVITAFPALLLTMRMRELGASVMFLALYALLVGFVLLIVFASLPGGGPPGEFVLGMFIAIYAFAATVISPLVVLWLHGYRLTWPRERKVRDKSVA